MGMLFDLFVSLYVVIIQVVIGTFISISGILQLQMSPNQGTCTGLLLVFVVMPIVLIVVGLISAVMMWFLEPNMNFWDSFGFSFSNLCALANPITLKQPENTVGIVLSFIVSSYT